MNPHEHIFERELNMFDDYSNQIQETVIGKFYVGSSNYCQISEASLSRTLSKAKNFDWAIITAYCGSLEGSESEKLRQNVIRNRELRGKLSSAHLGPQQLVGHWRECAVPNVEYKDCPIDKLIDVIERSYFIYRPDAMSFDAFESFLVDCATIDGYTQNAVVVGRGASGSLNEWGLVYPLSGKYEPMGDTLTLNKVAQAYSQHVRKNNVPFVFEGEESPANNWGMYAFNKHGLRRTYVTGSEIAFYRAQKAKLGEAVNDIDIWENYGSHKIEAAQGKPDAQTNREDKE